ncbi:MAG: prepilin peptidase [Candidatus Sphingomonas colombiensis]|nr:prepilin peptidase [Sphingomonas sp.]WEK42501.1 MAG: prepilin peptidase [Sphingomonas sp.]
MNGVQTGLLITLYAVLVSAAVMDIWKLRISNIFPAAVILLFLLWAYSCGWGFQLWQNAIGFALTFMGGLFLFSRGWMGGGDVKLFAAMALWFDFTGVAALYLYTAIGGAILSIAFILLRRMLPQRVALSADVPSLKVRGPIPYGLAISAGAILAIVGGNASPQPKPWYLQPPPLVKIT